ncbi:MAG: hypothetical protein ABJ333_12505, partial [Algoriphagus sp.]
MRKLILGFFILLPILMSCEEDEDKMIQTDLTKEAGELFSITQDWNESLYFAMISWEQYHQFDTVGLPGCPDILLDEKFKRVTLSFPGSSACLQAGPYQRAGELIIQFDTAVASPRQKWTMEYNNYLFEENSLQGIRTFRSDNQATFVENFTNVFEKTETELSTEFSGTFLHERKYTNDSLTSFSSTGKINGVNAAGREFEIDISTPLYHTISCYEQNEILPKTGAENWKVARGANS